MRSLLSPPHYYPEDSDMLKELADDAVSKMNRAISSGAGRRNVFCLRGVVQLKLQAYGFYGDVLEADAACMCADRPNACSLHSAVD